MPPPLIKSVTKIVRLETDHARIEAEKTSITGQIAVRMFHRKVHAQEWQPCNQVIVPPDAFAEWLDVADSL